MGCIKNLIINSKKCFLKKILKKPKFDGRMRIYLTIKCNLSCPYCVNGYDNSDFKGYGYRLRSPKDWINQINSIGRDVVFTGGEPFLYKGFADIINSINKKLSISIYTNFALNIENIIPEIKRKVHIYISFHPQNTDISLFIKNIYLVMNNQNISFNIHVIKANNDLQMNKALILSDKLKQMNIDISFDEDQRHFEGSKRKFKKKVLCSRNIILIAPDGDRFHCVSKLMRQKQSIENIFDSIKIYIW